MFIVIRTVCINTAYQCIRIHANRRTCRHWHAYVRSAVEAHERQALWVERGLGRALGCSRGVLCTVAPLSLVPRLLRPVTKVPSGSATAGELQMYVCGPPSSFASQRGRPVWRRALSDRSARQPRSSARARSADRRHLAEGPQRARLSSPRLCDPSRKALASHRLRLAHWRCQSAGQAARCAQNHTAILSTWGLLAADACV
jgi:hypothetical protein